MPLYTIYENPVTHEKLEIKVPLEYRFDFDLIRREIGLPDYVDLTTYQTQKIAAIIWASKRVDQFLPEAKLRSIDIAFFGGGAFKLTCPSANGHGSFARGIGDVDIVTLHEHGKLAIQLLCKMHEVCGSALFFGVTSDDKRFNNMRQGKRFRLRTIRDLEADGTPVLGFSDVFCDELKFCHEIPVQAEIKDSQRQHYTIGLEKMIISKAQYIKKADQQQRDTLDKSRILGMLDERNYLVGMERKDMLDVAALLADHSIGSGPEMIDDRRFAKILMSDWKLHRTVLKNLKNMRQSLADIVGNRIGQSELAVIRQRLDEILLSIGKEEKGLGRFLRFGKQWWEDVEDQVLHGAPTEPNS